MEQEVANSREFSTNETAFLIRIFIRQNATWMGEIQWLEGEKKLYFRSMLEMITLMQKAMDINNAPQAEYSFRSWEDRHENRY